jgi:thioredoxin 1
MSESTDPDDVEEIRKQKREELTARAKTPDEPVHVDGRDHLQTVVSENRVVLADFWAEWCGPCKMLEPILDEVAGDTPAAVAKIDVDEHQAMAGEFGVQGIPTLVLFVDGDAEEQLVGVQDEDDLRSLVARYA